MKKTLSILLSFIMLLSITAGIDLSAYANDPDNAPTISINGTYVEGTLTENDSAKFYKFTIPSDGAVTFKLMSYCYETTLYLYDEDVANGLYITRASGSSSAPVTGSATLNLSKGTYYMKAYANSSSSYAYGKFKVQAAFKSFNTNETEPNDFDNPMTLQKNALVTGALTQQDDADWYKFNVTSKCNVTLNFTHYYSIAVMTLYNSNLSEIYDLKSYDGTETAPASDTHTETLVPGTYYVKIYNYNSSYYAYSGKYSIKWSATCSTHSYKTTITPATTKANGKIVKKCSVCGASTTTAINKPEKYTLSSTSYTYDGKVKKPSVTVADNNGIILKKGTDYTLTYSDGRKNVGSYIVTINFKGNYSGTVKKTFTIKPKATSISKLTAGKKKFTVKWKKQATQTTGYEIQYSTSSKFKSAKTVTVSKNKTTSKTISKLKAKKKYYVRIRTYKTVKVNGKSTKIYSSWSKAKSVTTKK